MIEFIQEKSEKIPKRWRGLSLSFEKFEFREASFWTLFLEPVERPIGWSQCRLWKCQPFINGFPRRRTWH